MPCFLVFRCLESIGLDRSAKVSAVGLNANLIAVVGAMKLNLFGLLLLL